MTLTTKNNLVVVGQAAAGVALLLGFAAVCVDDLVESWVFFAGTALALYFLFFGGPGWFECLVWLAVAVISLRIAYLFIDGILPEVFGYYAEPAVIGYALLFLLQAGVTTGVITRSLLLRERMTAPQQPLCRSCGYDLTGNVSGVCPECGTQVNPLDSGRN